MWYIRGRLVFNQQLYHIRQSWKIIVIQDCWFFFTLTQLKRYVYSSPNISLVSNPSIVLPTLRLQFSFSLFPDWFSNSPKKWYYSPSSSHIFYHFPILPWWFFSEIDIWLCLTSTYRYDVFSATCHIRNL